MRGELLTILAGLFVLTAAVAGTGGASITTDAAGPDGDVVERYKPGDVPPIDGAYPTDPDGDGLYEDVNGNLDADFGDLILFFAHLNDPAVTENVEAYDFNGNDEIDFGDVVAFFDSLLETDDSETPTPTDTSTPIDTSTPTDTSTPE